MKRIFLALGLVSSLFSIAGGKTSLGAQGFDGSPHQRHDQTQGGLLLGPDTTYLGPIRPNAYRPGVNADATGRLFQWTPRSAFPSLSEGPAPWQPDGFLAFKADGHDQGGNIALDPTLRVTPNRYGLGVHADQYGRIVLPVCPFGQPEMEGHDEMTPRVAPVSVTWVVILTSQAGQDAFSMGAGGLDGLGGITLPSASIFIGSRTVKGSRTPMDFLKL